jgi:hypothetical protein
LRVQPPIVPQDRFAAVKYHTKVHSFRIGTAVLAWVLIGLAFFYRPDLIKWALRSGTHAIEAVGDNLPSPWGDRIEILLREVGGFLWIQITLLIIAIRVILSCLVGAWRMIRRHDGRI